MSFFDTNLAPYPLEAQISSGVPLPPPRAIFVFCILTSGDVVVSLTSDAITANLTLAEVAVGLTPEEIETRLTSSDVVVRMR